MKSKKMCAVIRKVDFMANVAIGPVIPLGGNEVQMTSKGKVQITNAEGKVKTLSQDQFKKQLAKNLDKIERGEDFEFKNGHKKAAIATASAAAAAVATLAGLGIAVQKRVLKPVRIAKDDVLLKKASGKIQNFAYAVGKKVSVYSHIAKNFAVEKFNKISEQIKEWMPKRAPKAEPAPAQAPAQQ